MLHFPILRSRRLTVQLQELSIGGSIAIASMPPHLEEAACTAFLRRAVQSAKGIEDPAQWSVQERMLVVCHYLACVSGDDGPDFSVGLGRYSDYLDASVDIPSVSAATVQVGELGGDVWHMRHLTGSMAESIERMAGEVAGITGRLHWLLGAMACQMVRPNETLVDAADGEGAFDEFLIARMQTMTDFPESDFAVLMGLFAEGRDKLHHLFRLEFAADGLVALPAAAAVTKGGDGGADLPPARFPAHACLSAVAHAFGRQPAGPGRVPEPVFSNPASGGL